MKIKNLKIFHLDNNQIHKLYYINLKTLSVKIQNQINRN